VKNQHWKMGCFGLLGYNQGLYLMLKEKKRHHALCGSMALVFGYNTTDNKSSILPCAGA